MALGIFYGSSTGNTKDVAEALAAELGAEAQNIAEADADTIGGFDTLIFAASTWGAGDLQDDWEDFMPNMDDIDFSGKKVGLVGLGDQENYGDTFVDGIATIAEKVEEQGGTIVGHTDTDGYEFDNSEAVKDGKFIGLVIDEDNQSDLTADRVKKWAAAVKADLA
jgi:flavodoxin I